MEAQVINRGVETPYYELTITYSIEGDRLWKCVREVSIDNPYLERFVNILRRIQEVNPYGDIAITEFDYDGITKQDEDFLTKVNDAEHVKAPFNKELEMCLEGDCGSYWMYFEGVEVAKIV